MTKAEIMAIEFQSTLPRRERLGFDSRLNREDIFQSTLPRRERLAISAQFLAMSIFQSTLPRRERPKDFFDQFVHLHLNPTNDDYSLPERDFPPSH